LFLPVLAFGQTAPKRIYIAPDDHTDYMWSGDEEAYRRAFIEMIDYYLDLADKTAKNPPEHQSRWNCDGSVWMWTYEHNRPPADFERLMRRVRDGHISMPLTASVSCYGAIPAEAVLRGMYYAGRLERRYNVRFPLAVAMEDQTIPYGLGALWAGAGARYSWKGICGCDSVFEKKRNQRRPHEVYWWRGPDGSRILMKWNTLLGDNKSMGGYAEAFDPAASIALVESEPFTSIYPYPVVGIFGKGWDNLKTLTDEFVTVARAQTNDARKVIVSNEVDFFQDLERTAGAKLPVFEGGFGNEWDTYSASLAEVSARVRRSVEGLRAGEALATLVSLKRPDFLAGRTTAREQAWMSLGLYWDHDWTSDSQVVSREAKAAWQRKTAGQVEAYAGSLLADASYALGGLIRKTGDATRFFVFNPLSRPRTDIADLPYDGPLPAHVVDLETGAEAPSQVVRLNPVADLKGQQHLRIQAAEVPPLGYKVYEVRPGAPQIIDGGPAAAGGVLQNEHYRVEVAGRGSITSLIDKSRGNREFAGPLEGRSVNDLGPGGGTLEIENAGPVSVTVKATSNAPVAHVTRITLFRNSPRIDIRNEITQNFADLQSWAFTFGLRAPDVWHEEVGAVIRARLTTEGGHYWPTHSRLDWLTLNHFADMSGGGGVGVTLSNADCAFMKLGASSAADGATHLDVTTPQLSVLAGGQVDGPNLGIPAQGGDTYFLQRFALETHGRFDPVEAMQFALEHQNPLVVGNVTGGSAYPEKSYSLVKLSDPNVLLWALKPAEEGIDHGIIARVWNVSPAPRSFSLSLAGGLAAAKKTTHIETDLEPANLAAGALSASAAPSQLLTFRLIPRQ
jgi:alpha-mannosidase